MWRSSGPDGNAVCRELRARRNVVPVIMLTARDSEADAVLAWRRRGRLRHQAVRPRGAAQPHRAVLPRAGPRGFDQDVLTAGDVRLDRASREVTLAGEDVQLTFSEFELLNRLMGDPGRLFNRQELLRAIWGDSAYRDPRAIDVHVRHLREKLEERPESPALILTCAARGIA